MKQRQYEFRGKVSKDFNENFHKEEWVYGSVIFREDEYTSTIFDDNGQYEVYTNTVTQFIDVYGYTGDYKDRKKNRIKLFEGDIVKAKSAGSEGTFVVTFRNGGSPTYILYPAWQNSEGWSIHADSDFREDYKYVDDLKLIGNVFDNPDIVKEMKGINDSEFWKDILNWRKENE